MKERQLLLEQFYGEVPGLTPKIDFSRKHGPLAGILGALRTESLRLENGGKGSPGERLVGPVVSAERGSNAP